MIIYQLKSPSGKSYIGQTRAQPEKRFQGHINNWKRCKLKENYYNNPTKLFHAFDKYSPENWDLIILESDVLLENLDDRERYWIKQLDTVKNGYNIKKGGGSRKTFTSSELHKNKISESRKEYFKTPKGLAWKEELKERMITNNPSYIGMPGKEHSEITKLKISKANKGKKINNEQKIKQKINIKKAWKQGKFSNRKEPTYEDLVERGFTMKGKKQTEKQKQAVKEAKSKEFLLINIFNNEKIIIKNLSDFCRTNNITKERIAYTKNHSDPKKNVNGWRLLGSVPPKIE